MLYHVIIKTKYMCVLRNAEGRRCNTAIKMGGGSSGTPVMSTPQKCRSVT